MKKTSEERVEEQILILEHLKDEYRSMKRAVTSTYTSVYNVNKFSLIVAVIQVFITILNITLLCLIVK